MTIIDGSVSSPVKNDFNGDGKSDVLARDTAGVLWLYPGNGTGGWLPRSQVGQGWNIMTTMVSTGDFNGDGKSDVLARGRRWSAMALPWQRHRRMASPQPGRAGMERLDRSGGSGRSQQRRPLDIAARDSSGTLWLYRADGRVDGWRVTGTPLAGTAFLK